MKNSCYAFQRLFTSLTIVLFGSVSHAFANGTIFQGEDGTIVIDTDSAVELGNWVLHTDNSQFDWLEGFSDSGCLQFTGNREHSGPPDSVLTFKFLIEEPGNYVLRARGLEAPIETKEGDKANDCYLRIVGQPSYKGEFTKFVLLGASYQWNWNIKLEVEHHVFETPFYSLGPGVHQVQIAGRSKNFFLDRLTLSRVSENEQSISVSSAPATFEEPASSKGYTLKATEDFKGHTAESLGEIYFDKNRDAIAINAANKELRNVFSAATTKFQGKSGRYDVTLKTLTEIDGESVYLFRLNGERIGRFVNTASEIDYSPSYGTWKGIEISKGDEIRVDSKPATNGKIPEGDETAWSRGRWSSLILTPSQ